MRSKESPNALIKQILDQIPQEWFAQIGQATSIDYQVSRLRGKLMFDLLLYGLLQREKDLSLRVLENYYNHSVFFQVLSGKGGHHTRHTSLADRLNSMPVAYFRQIFELLMKKVVHSNSSCKQADVLRFDSTLVNISAGLTQLGYKIGKAPAEGCCRHKLKFAIGMKENWAESGHLYTEKQYAHDDYPLRSAILQSAYSREDIVLFDRGLHKRATFEELDQEGIDFVTRLNENVRYQLISPHKQVQGQQAKRLILQSDEWVYLYDRGKEPIDTPLRLIRAKDKYSGEVLLFLTNLSEFNARQITDLYARRWDIEAFFRFLKQQLNFDNLLSYRRNGIEIMLYMILSLSLLLELYRQHTGEKGYKLAKVNMQEALLGQMMQLAIKLCGGNPGLLHEKMGGFQGFT